MPTRAPAGQMDLVAMLEDEQRAEQRAATPRCLYNSPARGPLARAAEFAEWQAEYGSFGSLCRSHAWTLALCVPKEPSARCQATALHADVRAPHQGTLVYPACTCIPDLDELMYRGACLHCDWEGDPQRGENPAVEDAMDHAWPGWRDMPVVPKPPFGLDDKTNQRWLDNAIPLYPAGWIENGGPVRTQRSKYGTRHHGPATPCGGYDMAANNPDQED